MTAMRLGVLTSMLMLVSACGRVPDTAADAAGGAAGKQAGVAASASADAPKTAGEVEFPVIPQIVVPDIIGVGPAQRALEGAMQDIIDPVAGISVKPANCATDGGLINDAGITSVDEHGNLLRIGGDGIFDLAADGSGTANFEGGVITVEADGSGSILGKNGENDDGFITIAADGSGMYNGKYGIIELDGKGAGSWNGDHGMIEINGDGSGTWNGPQGIIEIHADGSGTWNGPHGLIENDGNGHGRVGTPSREVAMAPIPNVAPAGKFPPLKKFAPPGAPCGFIITLEDRVLFDFDKSDLRPSAAKVLDSLAPALQKLSAKSMEIRGHTDAKGSDEYNQDLSERRAQSVIAALRQRGAGQAATAKGYGESQPVAPNERNGQDNPGGRQLNRRVEIFVRT